ncbi:hypothetical protein BJ170DRAFT_677573 [Xylariales sp. AK1849]|nr:hypothetical protein BJ170DRAFT_677573 [Xylariales sp. AK1849]
MAERNQLDPSRDRPSLAGPSSAASSSQAPKKKKHRGGRKHRRPRRKSFATVPEDDGDDVPQPDKQDVSSGFYLQGRNLSNTSIDSEALLDHRAQSFGPRPRRPSALVTSFQLPSQSDRRTLRIGRSGLDEDEDDNTDQNEGAPLLSRSIIREANQGYGSNDGRPRFDGRGSSRSSKKRNLAPLTPSGDKYNVNFPPSMPGSPQLGVSDRMGPDINFGDEMMRQEFSQVLSGSNSMMEEDDDGPLQGSPSLQRRHTIALQAEDDVCYPQEGMSEIADDDTHPSESQRSRRGGRRRRDKWPDLTILEEWSRFEKESRIGERQIKKITEPQLINGRLRPIHKGWYRTEEDAPYRFTYFNEEFQTTIHSQSISELVQPETSFRDLFIPDPPVLSDSSDEFSDGEETGMPAHFSVAGSLKNGHNGQSGLGSKDPTRQPSLATTNKSVEQTERFGDGALSPKKLPPGSAAASRQPSGEATPTGTKSPPHLGFKPPSPRPQKPVRYGDRPVWWLDVLSPTEAEMKVIQKTFGIHPLTSEDIMLQEQREKVELFRHYYFVNYRSFDQDEESETHLEPVNMYVVVFREGIISFHFSQTPHPANVRRRIRQLKDYIMLSSDWVSYAIIDDITDVFVPLIQRIEDEVDDIDDAILRLHALAYSDSKAAQKDSGNEKGSDAGVTNTPGIEVNMLSRIGNCRKKVMELYRLLGNKADVIKGFAKRCNEHWEIAPRSEIGLYLGDIQDHIITMTGNLGHYEKILARCHQNYLAQINIRMNERSEQTADTLGKLTVLGTIVLPMNIITGLWGMNVWVPGQEYEGNLTWFWWITAGLVMFGMACFLIAKRVYKIV